MTGVRARATALSTKSYYVEDVYKRQGVYCGASSGKNSHLVILNPDLTIKETVGTWNMGEFGSPDYIEQIIDLSLIHI